MVKDISDAISALVDHAKRNGKITPRTFSMVCKDYAVPESTVSQRFLLSKGTSWQDFSIHRSSRKDNLLISQKKAGKLFERRITSYIEKYHSITGTIYMKNGRQWVYVGSRDHDGERIHDLIDVMKVITVELSWADLHALVGSALASRIYGCHDQQQT